MAPAIAASVPTCATERPGLRISVAELERVDAARLASDFAAVLGESEAIYGG
jgi:hypothetical protein